MKSKRSFLSLAFLIVLLVAQLPIFRLGFVPLVSAETSTVLQVSVAASADDTWATMINDTTLYTTDTVARMNSYADQYSTSYCTGGFRFVLPIPAGATIISANLSIYLYTTSYDDANMKVYGDAEDNPSNFVDNAHIGNTTYRPRTDNYVSWVATNLGTGNITKTGFRLVTQEIVERAGWASGNALVLLAIPNTDAPYALRPRSYDTAANQAACLFIEYRVSGVWLSGWLYRESHFISYAAGAGANYQIKITAHYGSGVDGDDDVYLNSLCQADFDDVRFTDNDKITLLDYWLESKTDSDNSVFWVEVADSLSTVSRMIYVYYGNSSVTTASNLANTAIFGDDFEWNNLTRWTSAGAAWATNATTVKHGTYSAKGTGQATGRILYDNITAQVKGRIICYARVSGTSTSYAFYPILPQDSANCKYLTYFGTNATGSYMFYNNGSEIGFATYAANTWYRLELLYDWDADHCKIYVDGVFKVNITTITATSLSNMQAYAPASAYSGFLDDYVLFKYVSPEPAHGGWGIFDSNAPLIQALMDLTDKVNWTESISTVYLGTMFGKTNMTDLQKAIAASTDWKDVLSWSAYTTKFGIENETKIRWALNNASMVEGLPYSDYWAGYWTYCVHYRGLLYGYYWADKYSYLQDKWNTTTAFNNFASAYNHTGHGFLWYISPTFTLSIEYGPRYYDESAETLACFLTFYEVCNVPEALTYAETEWHYINNHLWYTDPTHGSHFEYYDGDGGFECEAGSFLQVIGWLKYLSPSVGNISRLMEDMSNRFIIDRWYSPQWTVTYDTPYPAVVVHHTTSNPERRLLNTVTAWSSLFSMYQLFNDTEIQYFQDELNGYANTTTMYSSAWKCLYNTTTGLYDSTTATFKESSSGSPTNYGTALATCLQFIMGMVPLNASLAVPVEELRYEYLYNMFDSQILNMSLATRKVTVGISTIGALNFTYNATITQMFNEVGLYELTFDSDWNTITNCTKVGSLPDRRYLQLVTNLEAGWSNFTAWNVDIGKTLEQTCANIQYGGIDAAVVIKYNGTEYRYDYGYEPNATVEILAASDELRIYCTTSGRWYHDYSNFNYRKARAPPIAGFVWAPAGPAPNRTILFDASSSLLGWNGTHDVPIVGYSWNFSDGNVTTVSSATITHVYGAAANYTVTLTITDANGLQGNKAQVVNVQTQAPLEGDINGDGRVDGKDVAIASKAYGTRPGDLLWDPRADVNGDDRVDGKDISIIAKYFGAHYP